MNTYTCRNNVPSVIEQIEGVSIHQLMSEVMNMRQEWYNKFALPEIASVNQKQTEIFKRRFDLYYKSTKVMCKFFGNGWVADYLLCTFLNKMGILQYYRDLLSMDEDDLEEQLIAGYNHCNIW